MCPCRCRPVVAVLVMAVLVMAVDVVLDSGSTSPSQEGLPNNCHGCGQGRRLCTWGQSGRSAVAGTTRPNTSVIEARLAACSATAETVCPPGPGSARVAVAPETTVGR